MQQDVCFQNYLGGHVELQQHTQTVHVEDVTTTFLYRCSSAGVVEDIMMCLKASFTAAHEATRRESLAKDHVEQCEECPLVCLSQLIYTVLRN